MIKLNKIAIFVIALILMLSLYACGGAGGKEQQNSPAPATTENTNNMEQQNSPDVTPADNMDDSGAAGESGSDNDVEPQKPLEDETGEEPEEPAEEPAEEVQEPAADSGNIEETSTADSIIMLAESLIGAEYEWGAAGPDTFDNSGFVYYCFAENGISLPRKTGEMYASGTAVEPEDLLPGDLVFFTYNEDRSASYVGIYMGGGQFIAENNEDHPVSLQDMTLDYFKKIYIGARRYF